MSTPMPSICKCYSVTDNDGIIRPVFCHDHSLDYSKITNAYGFIPKYSRFFNSEEDAKDTLRWIKAKYPSEGYGTSTYLDAISHWWLVRAWWGSAD